MNVEMYNSLACLRIEAGDDAIRIFLHDIFGRSRDETAQLIERMKSEQTSPWLRKMNARFATVGQRVLEMTRDSISGKSEFMPPQRFTDFRRRYMHIRVHLGFTDTGKEVHRRLGDWWLKHPHRRTYASLDEFRDAMKEV